MDNYILVALLTTFLMFFLIALILGIIIRGLMLMGMFSKFGEQRWKAFIPFYSDWILLEKIGLKGWYIFLCFIPFVGPIAGIVLGIMVLINLYNSFTDSQGNKFNLLGYILGFLFLGGLIPYLNYSYGDKWIYNGNVITNE